jgi:hypothetical protein
MSVQIPDDAAELQVALQRSQDALLQSQCAARISAEELASKTAECARLSDEIDSLRQHTLVSHSLQRIELENSIPSDKPLIERIREYSANHPCTSSSLDNSDGHRYGIRLIHKPEADVRDDYFYFNAPEVEDFIRSVDLMSEDTVHNHDFYAWKNTNQILHLHNDEEPIVVEAILRTWARCGVLTLCHCDTNINLLTDKRFKSDLIFRETAVSPDIAYHGKRKIHDEDKHGPTVSKIATLAGRRRGVLRLENGQSSNDEDFQTVAELEEQFSPSSSTVERQQDLQKEIDEIS